ncbi:hypothetical protein OHS70_04590 [Streptomyces sp. NBC_00390]|uniref:hypothetical protein n=1 Tax=Streptomyces sp. NBC_00390 TaxID=2975736 RepID=UPI002E1D50BB
MEHPNAEAWAEAIELFDARYAFVGVAARSQSEWWFDVASLIRGETQDPRGWRARDPYDDEIGLERPADPLYPWIQPPATPEDAESFRGMVRELPRSSVLSLLVLLGIVGMDVSKTWRFEERRHEMEGRAAALLARFPEGTRFYSNISWTGEQPDFYEQPVTGMAQFSQDLWDAGLIAVNDTEVAMFWTFESL